MVFLVMVAVNALIIRHRAQTDLAAHPEKEASYARLLRGYLFWLGLPWMVAGAIMMSGGATSVFDFFRPAEASLAVAGWHLLLFVLWMLSAYWVFVVGGAEELAAHPAFLRHYTPLAIKLWAVFTLVGGIAGELAMWSGVIPLPEMAK